MGFEGRLIQLYKPTDRPPPILEPTATKTYDAPIVAPQPTPTPTYVAPAPPAPPPWEAPPPPTVYKCPKCGAPFSSPRDLERHIIEKHYVAPPPPPSPEKAPLPTIYKCPKCGATFSSITELQGHIKEQHIEEEVDKMNFEGVKIPIKEGPVIREHTGTCPQCGSILQIVCVEVGAIPPSPERAIAPTSALCPVCGAVAYQEEGMVSRVKAVLERKPWPPEEEKPPEEKPVFPETKMIDEALNELEQQIRQLEEAFRNAKGAEIYDNIYAPIVQHATKLLATGERLRTYQYPRVSPDRAPFWTTAQKMRLEGLISRLKKLITDCREEAKRIKPLPTVEGATVDRTDAWVTLTVQERQIQGIPDYQWPSLTPKPTVTDGVPSEWLPYIGEPTPLGEYSVQERFAAVTGQEPWELAEAELAPAPSRLPYYIMGGLGVVALVAYIAKKKKKRS